MEALLILSAAVNVWLFLEVRRANKKYMELMLSDMKSKYFDNITEGKSSKRVYTKDLSNPRWQPKKRKYTKNPNNPYWKGRLA